jgi:hypothetical protein
MQADENRDVLLMGRLYGGARTVSESRNLALSDQKAAQLAIKYSGTEISTKTAA